MLELIMGAQELCYPRIHDDPLGWTLLEFFDRWYAPALRSQTRRRPPTEATIVRRRASVQHWSRLLNGGPAIRDLTQHHLQAFEGLIRSATYRRGPLGPKRPLRDVTQTRALEDVCIVLAALGPSTARPCGPRAELLADPPQMAVDPPAYFAPETWTLGEARGFVAQIEHVLPPRERGVERLADDIRRRLMRASVALWFYTGHRSTTYRRLQWQHLYLDRKGQAWLRIPRSVKTRKTDQVRVHPLLLEAIDSLRGLDNTHIFPWKCSYYAIGAWHRRLQRKIGIVPPLPIKTWRAFHCEELAGLGLSQLKDLASGTLGHSSNEITSASYYSVRNALIPLLPNLW